MDHTDWQPDGADNFRDLGGQETGDGRVVRNGLVYRSDTLQELTEADVRHLVERIGLRLVIDLRLATESEREGHGLLAASAARRVNLPLDIPGRQAGEAVPDVGGDRLVRHYLGYLSASAGTIVEVFRLLAEDELPAVIHCAAGKDRTGVVSALILGALGVPAESIAADYARSQGTAEQVFARLRRLPSYGERIDRVPSAIRGAVAGTMTAFLAQVENRYGSVPDLLAELGVEPATLARIRSRLVAG